VRLQFAERPFLNYRASRDQFCFDQRFIQLRNFIAELLTLLVGERLEEVFADISQSLVELFTAGKSAGVCQPLKKLLLLISGPTLFCESQSAGCPDLFFLC